VDASVQADFSWRTHVEELAEFISALELEPVHLVGHSRGGCVAFHLAREYPRLVKTLTLADPAGPLKQGDDSQETLPSATNALRKKVAMLVEAGAVETGLQLFVDSVSTPGAWKKSSPSFRTMALDNASTLPKQFRDPLPAYSRELAGDVMCKTLVIDGERSPRMFRDNVTSLADWIFQAERKTVTGASHGMNVTSPSMFNQILKTFLDS
jgi:pimeloyl-ACP methyl ester carboxylesterase